MGGVEGKAGSLQAKHLQEAASWSLPSRPSLAASAFRQGEKVGEGPAAMQCRPRRPGWGHGPGDGPPSRLYVERGPAGEGKAPRVSRKEGLQQMQG